MSVKECSPLCFRVALKVFPGLYFQARISSPLENTNKILSQEKMVIDSLEIAEFKEITLVLGQAQGADPGAVRTALCWEGGVTAALSHRAGWIVPCVSLQAHPNESLATVTIQSISHKMCHEYLHFLLSRLRLFPLPLSQQSQNSKFASNLPVYLPLLTSHKCICPWLQGLRLRLWSQLLCGLPEWPSSSWAFSPCLRHFHAIVVMILGSL